jgi:glycosyltransferase involved in cell wall biosynthesis
VKTSAGSSSGINGKRALFLFPTDSMGGAERITLTIAKEVASHKDFARVDCFILSRPKTGTLDDLKSSRKVTLHYSRARNECGGLFALIRILVSRRYDFVFSSHTHLNAFCSLLRRLGMLRTGRLVTRESTLIFERDFGHLGGLIRALYRFYGTQDLIICQTERMQQSLNRHTNNRFAAKCAVIPNPIDFDRIEMAKREQTDVLNHMPANATKIVWCGRLIPIKAPLLAIETLRVLHDLGKRDSHLLMIGEGPLAGEVRNAVRRMKLDRYVTLCGFQPNPVSIMARCDVGLLTSDTEGFPNVILEMLAAGVRRVVTTNCAGDLDTIPGVRVSTDFSSNTLAQRLIEELTEARLETTNRFLASRNPGAFLTRISGEMMC